MRASAQSARGFEETRLPLDTFYSRPGHLIRRLNQIAQGLFQEEAGQVGLTSVQYAALAMVREVPGIDQVRLSSLIAFDKTTIVKVLDRLVDKGLVTRTRSPEDRRSNLLHVTDNGLKLLKQIEPLLDRSDKRIVAPLNADEQYQFMALLTRLVQINNAYSRAPMDHALREDLLARRAKPAPKASAKPAAARGKRG